MDKKETRKASGPPWDVIHTDEPIKAAQEPPQDLVDRTMLACRKACVHEIILALPPVMPREEIKRFYSLPLEEQEAYLNNYGWEKFVKKDPLYKRISDWFWYDFLPF